MAEVAILVPWRGGDPRRERMWAYTRGWLEGLGYPLFTGDRIGPWSRAAAINAAARAAGAWNVAVIADADTIPTPAVVAKAIDHVLETGGACRPHDHLWRCTPSGTQRLMSTGPAGVGPRYTTGTYPGGGLLVVHRGGWDAVGGMDERFIGWGHEDSYFNTLMLAQRDWDRLPGFAWHLWHPESRPSKDRRGGQYAVNRRLMVAAQRKHAAAIAAASYTKGYDVGAVL